MRRKVLILLLSVVTGMSCFSPNIVSAEESGTNLQDEQQEVSSESVFDDAVSGTSGETDSTETSGSEIGEKIQNVLAATTQMVDYSSDQLGELQDTIADIHDNLDQLSDEERNILDDSEEALNNAKAAVDSYKDAVDGKTDNTEKESGDQADSFRYINGQPIREAMEQVVNETEASEANEAGEDQNVVDAIADGTADPVKGDASLYKKSDSIESELLVNNNARGRSILESSADRHIGIDVSYWQGTINWDKVKQAGIEYAIIKVGYGSDYANQDDNAFLRNAEECARLGIPYGVYLYSYAGTQNGSDAVAQAESEARHVIRKLTELKNAGITMPSLPVYYDVEENKQYLLGSGTLSVMCQRFFSVIEASGYNPGIYSSVNFFNNVLLGIASTTDYSRWVAQWPLLTEKGNNPGKTDNLTLPELEASVSHRSSGNFQNTMSGSYQQWQFYDAAVIDGISENVVDVDYWYGNLSVESNSSEDSSGTTDSMYRLYNPNSGEHFYTASYAERNNLISVGWTYEGIGWKAPKSSGTPVYRLYNPNAGDHHYTMSAGERDFLINAGWNYEGIGWYSDDSRTVPVYRQYNPNAVAGAHNYTTSAGERDHLVSVGWNDEGIGWYGLSG